MTDLPTEESIVEYVQHHYAREGTVACADYVQVLRTPRTVTKVSTYADQAAALEGYTAAANAVSGADEVVFYSIDIDHHSPSMAEIARAGTTADLDPAAAIEKVRNALAQ